MRPHPPLLFGAERQLLAQSIEVQVASLLAGMKDQTLFDGRDLVVRHGHGPARLIQTGIGPVSVQRTKVRNRADVPASDKTRFSSALRSLDALLPILYLRGISTGDFQEVVTALVGQEASNLSPSVIGRLKAE